VTLRPPFPAQRCSDAAPVRNVPSLHRIVAPAGGAASALATRCAGVIADDAMGNGTARASGAGVGGPGMTVAAVRRELGGGLDDSIATGAGGCAGRTDSLTPVGRTLLGGGVVTRSGLGATTVSTRGGAGIGATAGDRIWADDEAGSAMSTHARLIAMPNALVNMGIVMGHSGNWCRSYSSRW